MKIYDIKPVPKPRMTQSDKWQKRPCVVRYWEFKDEVNRLNMEVDSNQHIHFIIAIPKSWGKKKKLTMAGKPHKQKPDIDNLTKALLDAIHKEDAHIYDVRASKWWGEKDCIAIENIEPASYPIQLTDIDVG